MDRLLRDLTGDMRPFGGKVMVVGGDFRQLLPVLPRASEAEVVANTILQHYTLRGGTFRKFSLTENMRVRASGDAEATHSEWLLRLGAGQIPLESDLHAYAVQLPTHLCMEPAATCEDFLDWVFPDVLLHTQACLQPGNVSVQDGWFRDRAILTSRNDVANELNLAVLSLLDATTEVTSLSVDSVADPDGDDAVNFPTEFLHTLNPSGIPPHELKLRTGAVVIILRNLDKSKGICNGVRCIVLAVTVRALDVRIIAGPAQGKRYLLPRIPFRSSTGDLPFILRRRQFPVRLAWAMSIHIAQGQTLIRCGVFLQEPVFAHGQLYVAASRANTPTGLKFIMGQSEGHGYQDDNENNTFVGPYTHNIVYKAVLRMMVSSAATQVAADTTMASRSQYTSADRPPAQDHVESVDLSDTAESALWRDILRIPSDSAEEHGADASVAAYGHDDTVAHGTASTIAEDAPASIVAKESLATHTLQAQMLGVPPSVWHEVTA